MWRRCTRIMGVLVAASLVATGPAARAGLILEEDFSGRFGTVHGGRVVAVPGARLAGWSGPGGVVPRGKAHVEYDLASLGLGSQGTIEAHVVRDEREPTETLFSLSDGSGRRLLVFRVEWGEAPGARPEIWVSAPGRGYAFGRRAGGDLLPGLRLPRDVPRGGGVHLALTWGEPGGPAVYADGQLLVGSYNAEVDVAEAAAAARLLVLGAEIWERHPDRSDSTMRSTITNFRIHDRSLSALELQSSAVLHSVAAERSRYGAGQEMIVTLRATPGRTATFSVEGLGADLAMAEVDAGVYVGQVTVPAGVNVAAAALTARIRNLATGGSVSLSGPPVALDGIAPGPPARALARAASGGEVEVSWVASAAPDVDHYRVYRGDGGSPDLAGEALAEVKGLAFVDAGAVRGLTYQYAVVAVDQAGNRSAAADAGAVKALGGEGPSLTAVTVEPFGRPLRPGQVLSLAATGQSGGTLTADLGALATGLALAEQGRTGKYLGAYTVKDADVGATKGLHRVVAKLTDALGSSTLAGPEVAIVGRDALNDRTPPVIAKASHDGFQVAGFSGKLVAGDVLRVTVEGEPGIYGSFEVAGVAKSVPLTETRAGVYTGTYTVGWQDEGRGVAVTARLADDAGNETAVAVGRPVDFDTRVRLMVTAKDAQLPADRTSTTRLTAKATNANGDEVSGHELALTLSTTAEYTGVVGGGRLEGRQATKEDEDDLEVKWGGVTNAFGEVAATYTAGFAAKTALVVAKNLTTGDVGVGWLNTFVSATVALEVLPRAARMADRGTLALTAEPTWLTADGRSTTRLKAVLLDLAGNPVANARVAFALGNQNGRLKVLRGTTDAAGLAEAEYRAGTLAGEVTVIASAAEWGVTRAVQIELRADAPAKIDLTAAAGRVAVGERVGLTVRVSDVHDNPNIGVPVSFAVLQGSGSVKTPAILTDRLGEGRATFEAGSSAGLVVVEARHTSRAPSAAELRRVQGTVFVPRLAERQERDRVKVAEWLVKPGKEVEKGQALVVLEGGTGTWTLTAPEKGVLVRHVKHKRDRVELGDTLGYVEVDPEVWKDEYRQ